MIGLRAYRQVGVDELLIDAAQLIKSRGLAKGVRISSDTEAIDVIAALGICCGAKKSDLLTSVTAVDFPIASANETKYFMALEVLDARKPDYETWADHPDVTATQVAKFLLQAAEHLQRAVV